MNTPGAILKSERERRNIPLKDIARKLRINIKYLYAIEEDNYEDLPAEVFARSYIRLYADELELDSSALLALFENLGKPPEPEEPPAQEASPQTPPQSGGSLKKPLKPVLIAAAAGLLVLIVIIIFQKKEQPVEESRAIERTEAVDVAKQLPGEEERIAAPSPEPAESEADKKDVAELTASPVEEPVIEKPVPAPEEEPPAPEAPVLNEKTEPADPPQEEPRLQETASRTAEEEPAPVQQEAAPAPELNPAPVQHEAARTPDQGPIPVPKPPVASARDTGRVYGDPQGSLALKITALELTWVWLSIDSGKPREWHLRPGQTITLKGHTAFTGKIGNAGGTRLYFNDRDLGELGPSGKIIDITLP